MGTEPSGKAIAEYKSLIQENANLKSMLQVTPEKYKLILEATEEFIKKTAPYDLKIIMNGRDYGGNNQFEMVYKAKPDKLIQVDHSDTD